jgi:hypothetical protein
MTSNGRRYEDRWPPLGGVLYRLMVPVGLVGLIFLTLPLAMITGRLLFVLLPVLVALVAYCGVRSTVIAQGWARPAAAVLGLALTAFAAVLALGVWISTGGI